MNNSKNNNSQKSNNDIKSQANSLINDVDFNKSSIGKSGNSDVDVNVNVIVDTTSIAFAYLCSMLATKKMTNDEFDIAVRKLEEMTQRHSRNNDVSNVRLFNRIKEEKKQNNNRQQNQHRRLF
ncbi:hypothetical protein [Paenisporosarcina indica]|uniref:hypothetical protein n=1 Tax=Paenisporosarcina indica TaxID=650093 RepID=UPI000A03489E|nr:hypothetical protein [Paenisporosarcina indica]